MTRIKYTETNKGILVSPVFINFEGKRFRITLYVDGKDVVVTIKNHTNKIIEAEFVEGLSKAKRVARDKIINKYNVRINHEVRR